MSAALALIPVAGLLWCVLLHVMTCRYMWANVGALVAGVVGGGGLVAGYAVGAGQLTHLPVWLAAYLLLAYCYVIGVFNLGESSRRIRLLIELYEARGQTLTLKQILARYNARMVMEARLRRLVAAGQLVECDDGRYRIGHRAGLRIAWVLAWLTPILVGGNTRGVFISDEVSKNFRATRQLLAERLQRRR